MTQVMADREKARFTSEVERMRTEIETVTTAFNKASARLSVVELGRSLAQVCHCLAFAYQHVICFWLLFAKRHAALFGRGVKPMLFHAEAMCSAACIAAPG